MAAKRRSFTLLELVVVIIILGILATLGFVQYSKVVEKGRKAEASTNLGALRSLAFVWHEEGGHATPYPADGNLGELAGLPVDCASTHYFKYSIDSDSGTSTATRCTADGKMPDASTEYTMTLTIEGDKGGEW